MTDANGLRGYSRLTTFSSFCQCVSSKNFTYLIIFECNNTYLERTYIAKLLDKALTFQPKVIGIGYVLSNPIREDDPTLQQAVAQKTWLVFGSQEKDGQELSRVTATIASPKQTLNRYVTATPGYVELLPKGQSCQMVCPFAYLLALAQSLQMTSIAYGCRTS